MTTEHRSALQRAVAAHKAVTDAMQAESKRIADEREQAASAEVAVRPEGSAPRQAKEG